MTYSFTKLFSTLPTSTIWCEDSDTRVVWITMLAMADRKGRVLASIPGLAKMAAVSIEAVEGAIAKFLAPDKHSRSKAEDGRRIREIDGGWELINHEFYRNLRDEETWREQKRDWARKSRRKPSTVEQSRTQANQAEAEAEAEAEANTERVLARIRAIGFRDSQAISVEHALFDEVIENKAHPAEILSKLAKIYVWTKNGTFAPRLHEVIRRWREPQELWDRRADGQGNATESGGSAAEARARRSADAIKQAFDRHRKPAGNDDAGNS